MSLYTILGIHQLSVWVRNNVWLVLKLQLILGDLCFIFSTNDLSDKCTCFIYKNSSDLHTIWFSVLNNYKSLKVFKPHFYCVELVYYLVTLTSFFKMFRYDAQPPRSCKLNTFFLFFFSVFLNWSYVHQNAERVSKNWIYS